MSDTDLQTDLLVTAALHQCTVAGIGAYVHQKGAASRGTILLKINKLENGCQVLSQVRDIDGNLNWMDVYADDDPPADEAKIDAYLKRAMDRDPDVWVIEIEDKAGQNPFETAFSL